MDSEILPQWDLSDLYTSPTAVELVADLARAEAAANRFAEDYTGKVGALSAPDLAQAIIRYEQDEDLLGRIGSYAQLRHAANVSDREISRFYQTTMERLSGITSKLIFFTLELNKIGDESLDALLTSDPGVARYAPWLRDVRASRPHQLSDEQERLLHEKQVTGRAAWVRLFDETMADMRFSINGEERSLEQTLHLLQETDGTQRKAAAKALGAGFNDKKGLFALITNTLAKDKAIEDKWRRFARPDSARHLSNHVEDAVVDALRQAVTAAYPRLSHRYYALKARWFGAEALDYWDRNAPLPDEGQHSFTFSEARDRVLAAYGQFSPVMAQIGQRFFDNAWIDAPASPGKSSGAFAHPTVPSAHPYLLLNYQGRVRDVMTLAHELGHGVHQVLAAEQGALMADTPLTLAETASVFGEQLTFRALLEAETSAPRRRAMLAGKTEDMLNTVVRQIAFYDFERRLHDERCQGEISVERIGEIWMAVQAESLGPAIRLHDEYANYWCYIPHFVHSPFYVYAYAFGDCLVNSLYAVYQKDSAGFAGKYLDMLRAGGTLRHRELLAPFGLDATDPGFWQQGLGVIERFIDELEELS
ncbi:MAG: M3 family oligoendopeptidase [Proteobacteria bacterium]|nr:M3 family oligoendopeptidase [Pseudomonadota bacterium]